MPLKTPVKKPAPASKRAAPAKAAAPKPKVTTAGGKPLAAKPRAAAKKPVASRVRAAAAPVSAPTSTPVKPAAKAKTAAKAPAPAKDKSKKPKLVRDSFTMPQAEYQVLADLKKACIKAGFAVKKSELLRIGVALLQKTNTTQLQNILASLPPLKAGRPKKSK